MWVVIHMVDSALIASLEERIGAVNPRPSSSSAISL